MILSSRRSAQLVGGAITTFSLAALAVIVLGPPDLLASWLDASTHTSIVTASSVSVSSAERLSSSAVPQRVATWTIPDEASRAVSLPTPTKLQGSTGDTWFEDPPRAVFPGDAWFKDAPQLASAQQAPPLPITGLQIRSVSIITNVVEAPLVEQPDGAFTWEVPKFVAGHAEATAGAGEVGNAVLFGHVTSMTLGNVFENLHNVHVGDLVEVYSGTNTIGYQVVAVRSVARTDGSVVDPTTTPTVTLITCTGMWNPLLHDYMERLVVIAQRVPSPPGW
jgi:LPXTG-site transpeptidase (sortase) family protein